MKNYSRLVSSTNLNEWFRDRLLHESHKTSPSFSDDTVSYLVNLLTHFSRSENFFTQNEHGLDLPTLAFLFRDANNAATPSQKILSLRHLGDSALFIGALFSEKFTRAGIKKDYYIGMGGGAYRALAEYSYDNQSVYNELSARFPRLLEVVAKVCSRDVQFDADEIFALYKRWQMSGDELLKRQLLSLGIGTISNSATH